MPCATCTFAPEAAACGCNALNGLVIEGELQHRFMQTEKGLRSRAQAMYVGDKRLARLENLSESLFFSFYDAHFPAFDEVASNSGGCFHTGTS